MKRKPELLNLFSTRTGRTNHVPCVREPRIEELCGFMPSYRANTKVRGEVAGNYAGDCLNVDLDAWMKRRTERERLRRL